MSTPRPLSLFYRSALAGREPAESLGTHERYRLFTVLWRRGWTDLRIAEHTRWSTYTVARIRDQLGLTAHTEIPGAA